MQQHRCLNTFSQLPAVKKYSKNGAAGNFFDQALGTDHRKFRPSQVAQFCYREYLSLELPWIINSSKKIRVPDRKETPHFEGFEYYF